MWGDEFGNGLSKIATVKLKSHFNQKDRVVCLHWWSWYACIYLEITMACVWVLDEVFAAFVRGVGRVCANFDVKKYKNCPNYLFDKDAEINALT
ncbi:MULTISPECIES: hypothetical protein [Burkholderia]|uniref:hypothetical protein n=1 Tax=Burkholderia TaxID=32008 RepID=UPI001177BA58|nr:MULTISPECIES: hypothetical protein [Burkholderia]EKS9798530.1 hypothetical protein [Burkholderia cepacia]EKS9805476.1 hypothetical protein [Burkholderia cepacia]EKS9812726.1 hypothetical protein [Burkholderia cepacia]EKS9819969.1 hypothetical protein [Burkholderia cepacia]EKS9829034.1 hypothetical protein [Burkholderia cepacia]